MQRCWLCAPDSSLVLSEARQFASAAIRAPVRTGASRRSPCEPDSRRLSLKAMANPVAAFLSRPLISHFSSPALRRTSSFRSQLLSARPLASSQALVARNMSTQQFKQVRDRSLRVSCHCDHTMLMSMSLHSPGVAQVCTTTCLHVYLTLISVVPTQAARVSVLHYVPVRIGYSSFWLCSIPGPIEVSDDVSLANPPFLFPPFTLHLRSSMPTPTHRLPTPPLTLYPYSETASA